MPRTRRSWLLAGQVVLAAVVLFFIGRALVRQWEAFRGQPLVAHPRWGIVVVSGLVVLATYAVLIQTWRAILHAWDARLGFVDAARIWSISNLARYIPGTLWPIGLMAAMAKRERISPLAATGSSLLNVIVNIACGIAVSMVAGWAALDVLSGGHATLGFVLIGIIALGLLLLPFLLPRVLPRLARLVGRDVGAVTLPPRAVAGAVVGNVVAWVLYGIAFRLLVTGVLGSAAGTVADYVAIFASSYVAGYVVLVLPAGAGVRDATMATALAALHLATPQQALLVAVASRLWLTVLELVPGFLFLAFRPSRGRPPSADLEDAST